MRVIVEIESLKVMCLHPQNDTYPIFSAIANNFTYDYKMFFDHDTHHLIMRTLEVLDHTQYPNTLDPKKTYNRDHHISSNKILMRKSSMSSTSDLRSSASSNNNMFDMQMLMFHFPMERTCPQAHHEKYCKHDKFVKMEMKNCKLHFI